MPHIFLKWTDKYKTGITIIDEQHRGLASLINSFYFHKSDPIIERILVPTATMMINFAKIHFLTEEQLMEESGYPNLEEHHHAHREAYKKLRAIELKARRARDADAFLAFLKTYWLEHVAEYDRQYIDHLVEFYGHRK